MQAAPLAGWLDLRALRAAAGRRATARDGKGQGVNTDIKAEVTFIDPGMVVTADVPMWTYDQVCNILCDACRHNIPSIYATMEGWYHSVNGVRIPCRANVWRTKGHAPDSDSHYCKRCHRAITVEGGVCTVCREPNDHA